MRNLYFNKNYNNKLSNEVLTTIRLADADKFKIGEKFTLKLRTGSHTINHGEYKVIDSRILEEHQLNNWITQMDCATDVSGFKTIMRECYPNELGYTKKYSYVLLEKVKLEVKQQTLL